MSGARVTALVLVAALAAGCGVSTSSTNGDGSSSGPPVIEPVETPSSDDGHSTTPDPSATPPLAGKVVVLDPGHQLGNRRHLSEITRPVDAGGFDKECNTTGAATDSGFPEATFTWRVAVATRRILRDLGARVLLTRSANSDEQWGPCVDERGTVGNPDQPGPAADLRLSIHADGVATGSSGGSARGFHVIRPGVRDGWTDDIASSSRRLAVDVRDALEAAGFPAASYVGNAGIEVRRDLGTLNHSDVPAVMVELGNMRDERDAATMVTGPGQRRHARALADAISAFLDG